MQDAAGKLGVPRKITAFWCKGENEHVSFSVFKDAPSAELDSWLHGQANGAVAGPDLPQLFSPVGDIIMAWRFLRGTAESLWLAYSCYYL